MLSGVEAYTGQFLADVANIEDRIGRENRQISSGLRVQQASDDPSAVSAILTYQKEISRVTQVQTNLNQAKTVASTADGVLQSVSQMMDQLTSIAAQGASSTSSTSTRQVLADQVKQLEQQLVSLANTTVQGRYIFGGDSPEVAPYTYSVDAKDTLDPVNPKATVNPKAASTNTIEIEDASGNKLLPSMTAQQIFGVFGAVDANGKPAGTVFNGVHQLFLDLKADNQAGVQNDTNLLKSAGNQVSAASVFYGNTENWMDDGNTYATQHLADLKGLLSQSRDADIISLATQLTTDKTALDASLSAQASLNHKSLFDYLG